jgi:hypothetical protein
MAQSRIFFVYPASYIWCSTHFHVEVGETIWRTSDSCMSHVSVKVHSDGVTEFVCSLGAVMTSVDFVILYSRPVYLRSKLKWINQLSTQQITLLINSFTGAYSPGRHFDLPFQGFLITHIQRHTVGLHWMSDQPVAEASTYTGQHNI